MKTNMNLHINDLSRIPDSLREELEVAVVRVVRSGSYVLGDEVKAFEAELASYLGAGHALGVGNGTDALTIALQSLGIEPGDQVATVANASVFSTVAIRNVGAVPVHIDVVDDTLLMDLKKLREYGKNKLKAVIVTHLYGQMMNMPEVLSIAKEINAFVIEDSAQAHGARLQGKCAGTWGDLATFSFYPSKNIGALGDGGAVVTNDPELAKRVDLLRNYGNPLESDPIVRWGSNSRLDEMQAAILRAKLPYLDAWNQKRRDIALLYNKAFSNLNVRTLPVPSDSYVAHLYVIRSTRRAELIEHLEQRGIHAKVHYPNLLKSELEVTRKACEEVLSLPCFPWIKDEELQSICEAVADFD